MGSLLIQTARPQDEFLRPLQARQAMIAAARTVTVLEKSIVGGFTKRRSRWTRETRAIARPFFRALFQSPSLKAAVRGAYSGASLAFAKRCRGAAEQVYCNAFSRTLIISGEGFTLPARFPWAIISGVQPYLFLVFQTSGSAPRSINNWATAGKLR